METLFGTLCLRREANPARMLQCRELCRFLGRRVAAFERGALFAGVRETPRHEIAGAVRGGFRQSYGESVRPGLAPGSAERRRCAFRDYPVSDSDNFRSLIPI